MLNEEWAPCSAAAREAELSARGTHRVRPPPVADPGSKAGRHRLLAAPPARDLGFCRVARLRYAIIENFSAGERHENPWHRLARPGACGRLSRTIRRFQGRKRILPRQYLRAPHQRREAAPKNTPLPPPRIARN